MKALCFTVLTCVMLQTARGDAHELETGQILFTRNNSSQQVKTPDYSVLMEFIQSEDSNLYSISLQATANSIESQYIFEQPTPLEPRLDSYNEAYYCDHKVLFITLRYPIPRMADIRQNAFETHAFLAKSLAYLDTADAPFEGIAPHEDGADLGFPYEMPQPFRVYCSNTGGSLIFSIKRFTGDGG